MSTSMIFDIFLHSIVLICAIGLCIESFLTAILNTDTFENFTCFIFGVTIAIITIARFLLFFLYGSFNVQTYFP